MGEALSQGDAADRVMPLEQYAAVTALIDSGRRRDDVLVRVGLSPQGWMAAQTHWLLTMAEQARLDRFELQNRFNDLLLEHLEAIEAGAEPLSEADGEEPGEAAREEGEPPAGSSEPARVPSPPAGEPAPVAPPPVVPPAAVVLQNKPGAVGGVLTAGPPAAPGAPSPWSDGSKPSAPPSPPAVGRPKQTTLSPFAAVAAPMMGRAVRSEGDGILPFEPPPMPTAGGAAGPDDGGRGSGPSPAAAARPFVLPFSMATPGRTEPSPATPTKPGGEPVAVSAALPFAESPSKPQEQGAGSGGALPFSGGAPAVVPKPPPKATGVAAPPAPLSAALPFDPAPAASPPPRTAASPDPVGSGLPFQSSAEAKPPPAGAAAPPAAVAPAAPDPAPIDLSSTMHVTVDHVPHTVLPFAGSDDGGSAQPAKPARPVSPDGALPFQSQQPAAAAAVVEEGADESDDNESLAGTVSVGAGGRLEVGKPRLSLEQFASLSAEIAVHPERRGSIEQRYGLAGGGHDREKGAWAVAFLNDEGLVATYREKLAAYRAWLERKGPG